MTSNSVYETVYSSRSTYMKYMNKMTELWAIAPETGSYMKYMTHTLASGARGRGFESAEHDVRMPYRTRMHASAARIARYLLTSLSTVTPSF